MTNSEIAERLEDAMALMDLLEHNSFKINAFRSVTQVIEKLPHQLQTMEHQEREALFSKSMAKTVGFLLETGSFPELLEMEALVPIGVRTLFLINGIGPKKIRTLWKEAGIESVSQLKEACLTGQVALLKGFGEKIQQTILEGISFLEEINGKMLMHKGLDLGKKLLQALHSDGLTDVELVGDVVTATEVVSSIEFLAHSQQASSLKNWLVKNQFIEMDWKKLSPWLFRGIHSLESIPINFHLAETGDRNRQRYLLNSTHQHWEKAKQAGIPLYTKWLNWNSPNDEAFYEELNRPFIPVDIRVGSWEWSDSAAEKLANLIEYTDLRGCIHNHSRYSDGKNTIKEMADWCINQGWSYFGIADHSKSAHYAQGMWEEKVLAQWKEVDALNAETPNFKIFKGVESDILADGSLDYDDDILKGFDYVVASVHSGMKMDIDTATNRLIKAIENPYTRVLGHCSGRILLRRAGYPLHYSKIIDACIANQVAIEINAHPSRLDMDWENLSHAVDRGAFIAINPDAHEREGMDLMRFGTLMARKAGASKSQIINSFETNQLANFFSKK